MNVPELPNFISLITNSNLKDTHLSHVLHSIEAFTFTALATGTVGIIFILAAKKSSLIPGKMQNALEFLVEALFGLISGILGKKHAVRYFPYLATLFVFIWCNNMMGIIPFFKSSTSVITTTLPLALLTFIYVQYTALTSQGLFKYLYHLAGSPTNLVTYLLAPFMFVLHLIGEISRPITLALRLFGNIFGHDIALGIFAGFGLIIASFILNTAQVPVGLPLQLPFVFMGLLASTVQALVFTLLSTIYLLLAISDDEHH